MSCSCPLKYSFRVCVRNERFFFKSYSIDLYCITEVNVLEYNSFSDCVYY